jgi:hypothetical protein
VVEQASAFKDMDSKQLVPGSDHFDICRPCGPVDLRYMPLKMFLKDRWPVAQVGIQGVCAGITRKRCAAQDSTLLLPLPPPPPHRANDDVRT